MKTVNIKKELANTSLLSIGLSFYEDRKSSLLEYLFYYFSSITAIAWFISWLADAEFLTLFFICLGVSGVYVLFMGVVYYKAINEAFCIDYIHFIDELQNKLTDKDEKLSLAQQIEARVEKEKHELRQALSKTEARVEQLEARLTKASEDKDLAPLRLKNTNEELANAKARIRELEASFSLGIARVLELEPRYSTYKARRRQKKHLPEISFKEFYQKPDHYESLQ